MSGSTEANISGRHTTASAASTSSEIHDLPGEQAELVGRPARVQGQEQHAQTEPERHQHADDRGPLPGLDPQHPDDHRGQQRSHNRADDHVHADQQRERGPGKGQLADPVHRERQVPHHHEDADQPADQAQDGPGQDRVVQQGQQLAVVVEVEDLVPDAHRHSPPSSVAAWSSCDW
jgi:hypothetical protein